MGIYLYLHIAGHVTKAEWERAYEETLKLVNAFPFIEEQIGERFGARWIYAAKTKERELGSGNGLGWRATGDSETMHTAKEFVLPRRLTELQQEFPGTDPLMSILPTYGVMSFADERCTQVFRLWGNKTQGEPYHILLLAVACLLENRLPGKAAVCGDITLGQYRAAIRYANAYLTEKLVLPDRCDVRRLYKRLRGMPLTASETVSAFEVLYLGVKDEQFGRFLTSHFTEDELTLYWKRQFAGTEIGSPGFRKHLKEYLLWGFGVGELGQYLTFVNPDGEAFYEVFVREILRCELHLEQKDCEDILEIDPEDEHPYSIYTLMAQFAFAGAHNPRVNRYIPWERLKEELKVCVGEYCDVSEEMEKYRKEEKERQTENKETPADTSLLKSFRVYRSALDEPGYRSLLNQTAEDCCRFLIEENRGLLLRLEDWERIFQDIRSNRDHFARYYPMVRVNLITAEQRDMARAIVLNDDLYRYCLENV